jgi:hypothetical protein
MTQWGPTDQDPKCGVCLSGEAGLAEGEHRGHPSRVCSLLPAPMWTRLRVLQGSADTHVESGHIPLRERSTAASATNACRKIWPAD